MDRKTYHWYYRIAGRYYREDVNLVIKFLLSEMKDCEGECFGDDCKQGSIGER